MAFSLREKSRNFKIASYPQVGRFSGMTPFFFVHAFSCRFPVASQRQTLRSLLRLPVSPNFHREEPSFFSSPPTPRCRYRPARAGGRTVPANDNSGARRGLNDAHSAAPAEEKN